MLGAMREGAVLGNRSLGQAWPVLWQGGGLASVALRVVELGCDAVAENARRNVAAEKVQPVWCSYAHAIVLHLGAAGERTSLGNAEIARRKT